MKICVAGPYSADSEVQKVANLDAINETAARLLEMGHIPLAGVNSAIPVVSKANVVDKYEAIMAISMAVVDMCDAMLIIGESRGANRERDYMIGKGLPVYNKLEEVPNI